MLSAIELSKHFGERTLLDKIQFTVKPKERVGLVGRNGCGKTTLLKILAGLLPYDSGRVVLVPGYSLGYLGQEGQLTPENTLYTELQGAFSRFLKMEERLRQLEAQMSSDHLDDQQLREYSRLQEQVLLGEPHLQDAKIRSTAYGLGFSESDLDKQCGNFSGGWQMRGALARLLLTQPDVLLLDEPTNHLDVEGVEWLESFLLDFHGAVLIISHDRTFLDRILNRTVELSEGELEEFAGNYSYYLEESARRFELQLAAYKNQQKKLVQDRRFIERFRSKATLATRVKSREKMLEKIEMLELPTPEKRSIRISFTPSHDSGRTSLTAKGLSKSYPKASQPAELAPVFKNVSVTLERGEKVAIVGHNGTGKSTLLRLLAQTEAPDEGKVHCGYRLLPAYFAQHQAEALAQDLTPMDELSNVAPAGTTQTELRTLLGCLLFQGDDVFKKIAVLSGGERSRVALAKCMITPSNLLFLDEPTNHLDISSRDVLMDALAEYPGSLVMVTHDRYMMDQLATSIWEMENGKVTIYPGSYSEYRRKKEAQSKIVAPTKSAKPLMPKNGSTTSAATATLAAVTKSAGPKKTNHWKLEALEKKIDTLEKELSSLSHQMADPEIYSDYQKLSQLQAQFDERRSQCDELTSLWEEMIA